MYNPVSFTIFNPGDSSTYVAFLLSTHKHFHSFYEEVESGPHPTSVKTKNLFLALAENIAQTLIAISCCVCGRPFNSSGEFKKTRVRIWHLKTSIIDRNCLALLTCLGQIYYNATTHTSDWWGNSNYTEPNPHPLASFSSLKTRRDDLSTEGHWPTPEGLLYWICGANAYSILPANWSGGMLLGTIHLSFFLLPLAQGDTLGVPVYTDRGLIKKIIWLQAVVEIFTNEVVKFHNLLAEQQTKMHNVIYQNHLALDYLLATERGVCGKLNLSNCCLQIDDKGKVIEEITRKMTKIAHVPVQIWKR
ncbi:hypothetical protein FD754_023612 [Muntiacus muntjak]|uniref:Uncharacterized protein n=1 Tax=Muntiacus muntjak TaxID=9888 RepID=A0A5N3USU7_MUNMU|nr:hypothetical protein FD754_023612 [Muntiacus muntjak]